MLNFHLKTLPGDNLRKYSKFHLTNTSDIGGIEIINTDTIISTTVLTTVIDTRSKELNVSLSDASTSGVIKNISLLTNRGMPVNIRFLNGDILTLSAGRKNVTLLFSSNVWNILDSADNNFSYYQTTNKNKIIGLRSLMVSKQEDRYFSENDNKIEIINDNEENNGIEIIHDNDAVISTFLSTTIIDTISNEINVTLPNAPTNGVIKNISLLTDGMPANIRILSGGTLTLSAGRKNVTLLFSSNTWSILDSTDNNFSYYPSTQQAKVFDKPALAGSTQGSSCSLSADGNTLAVGGKGDNGCVGATWVYIRNGSVWTKHDKIIGTSAIGLAEQGCSCSLSSDGSTLAVGGPNDDEGIGATWVFTRNKYNWSQQAKIIGTSVKDLSAQGTSCSLSADGNTLAVGGQGDNLSTGAVWIFTRKGNKWSQQTKIKGTVSFTYLGISCSLSADGNTLATGGYGDNGLVGATWVYIRNGSKWTEHAKLIGTTIQLDTPQQGYSCSLSADGCTLAIGGHADHDGIGAVWIFSRNGTSWSEQAKLSDPDVINANQGTSCSLSADGNTLAIGGPLANNEVGVVWIYTRIFGIWFEQSKLIGTPIIGYSCQGKSCTLSADGGTLAFGGDTDDNRGSVWIYV